MKRAFAGTAKEVYEIPGEQIISSSLGRTNRVNEVPGLNDCESMGIRRNKFQLTGSDLRTIFEPVVKEIKLHVMRQVDATETQGFSVKTVLLVGGFGQCAYLRDSIRKKVEPRRIQVIQ